MKAGGMRSRYSAAFVVAAVLAAPVLASRPGGAVDADHAVLKRFVRADLRLREGRLEEARSELERAREIASASGRPASAARALLRLSRLEPWYRRNESLARLDEAAPLAAEDPALAAEVALGRGSALLALGRGDEAGAVFEGVLSTPGSRPDAISRALRGLSRLALAAGELDQAEARLLEAAAASPATAAGPRAELAELLLERGRRASAEREARAAAAAALRAGDPVSESAARIVLVETLLAADRADEALVESGTAMELRRGDPEAIRVPLELGLAFLARGRLSIAADLLARAGPPTPVERIDGTAVVDRLALEVGLAESFGDHQGAEIRLRDALATSAEDADLSARIRGRLGTLLRSSGRTREAVALHEEALLGILSGRFPAESWWNEVELAESLHAAGAPLPEIDHRLAAALARIPGSLTAPRSRLLRRIQRPDVHEAIRRVAEFRIARGDLGGAFEAAELAFARNARAAAATFGGRATLPASVDGLAERLRAGLGPDRALLASAAIGHGRVLFFIVRKEGITVADGPTTEEARATRETARRSLAAGRPDPAVDTLFAPALAGLARDGRWPAEILLLLDPRLEELPFEHCRIDAERAVHDVSAVTRISSATSWLEARHREPGKEPLRTGPVRPIPPGDYRGALPVRFVDFAGAPCLLHEIPLAEGLSGPPVPLFPWLRALPPISVALFAREGTCVEPASGPPPARTAVADTFLANGGGAILLGDGNFTERSVAPFLALVRRRLEAGDDAGTAVRLARRAFLDGGGSFAVACSMRLHGDGGARIRPRRRTALLFLAAGSAIALAIFLAARAGRRRRRRCSQRKPPARSSGAPVRLSTKHTQPTSYGDLPSEDFHRPRPAS